VEAHLVPRQSRADRRLVAAQPIAKTATAIRQQLLVQGGEAGGTRDRHQVVPPDQPDQTLHLALVVALARAAEPIGEQVMRLQFAEHARPLPGSVAQDPPHRQLGVVVQDRRRHTAEERERRRMPGAECLRRLRRIGLHGASVAVRRPTRPISQHCWGTRAAYPAKLMLGIADDIYAIAAGEHEYDWMSSCNNSPFGKEALRRAYDR